MENSRNIGNNTQMGTISNPVFTLKVLGLNNQYEQKPSENQISNQAANDIKNKFSIGDIVTGKSIKDNKKYSGKILSIQKNNNDSIISIITKKRNTIQLNANTCAFKEKSNIKNSNLQRDDLSQNNNKINIYGESYVMSFNEFKKLNS